LKEKNNCHAKVGKTGVLALLRFQRNACSKL